jgi:hypothetical protein
LLGHLYDDFDVLEEDENDVFGLAGEAPEGTEDLLANSITVSVSIDGLDQDVSDILPLLDHNVKVLIISEADSEALAGIGHDLLITDNPNNLDHLLEELIILQDRDDTLILSEARREAPNQILNEHLRFVLDAHSVEESDNCLGATEHDSLFQVLIIDQQRLQDREKDGQFLIYFLISGLLLVRLKHHHAGLNDIGSMLGENIGILQCDILCVI